jgi:hydrogenase maturation protease
MVVFAASDDMQIQARILCLGNDLLADDAFGGVVAGRLRRSAPAAVDIVFTANTGLSLLDYLVDVQQLVVVDTIMTGQSAPGSVRVIRDGDLPATPGSSPHYIGLFEALALARVLDLKTPEEVTIVAVEAADCTTIGGPMSPAVLDAVPIVLRLIGDTVSDLAQVSVV